MISSVGRVAIRTCLGGLTIVALLASAGAVSAAPHPGPRWQIVHSSGTADLRALSPVSARVVWASGSNGTVLRTTNGGHSWQRVSPPGTGAL